MASEQMTRDEETPPPVVVPHAEVPVETLHRVVEAFVLREGTEYGARDFTLSEKVEQVLRQLVRGEARIIFDPTTETIDIVAAPRRR